MENSATQIYPQPRKVNFNPAALTPDVLFRENTHGLSMLARLTFNGYLSQIPEECLTNEVVYARKDYRLEKIDACDFLYFCAVSGWYRDLPKRFQERLVLITRHDARFPSLLDTAILFSKIDRFPTESLLPNDLDEAMIMTLIAHKKADCVQNLIAAKHITRNILSLCAQKDYFPECVLRHATANQLIGGQI